MKVIIQKPDLDTCLTGLIAGVREDDAIVAAVSEASAEDIADPLVLCIEAGGSGLVELNCFDHHDPAQSLPPACWQAMEKFDNSDPDLARLVDYVCMVDSGGQTGHESIVQFPSLSAIFSGMRLVERGTFNQFFLGIRILRKVLEKRIDPFGTMPDLPSWRGYRAAKERCRREVERAIQNAKLFTTNTGAAAGFLECPVPGGMGHLYALGCAIAVLYCPAFGDPPVAKYTIAGKGLSVAHLLPWLNAQEPGWGGRAEIIGSPWRGSDIPPETIIDLVHRHG